MYPPPPRHIPPRPTGFPIAVVVLIALGSAMVFGLGGCVFGYAIGATPDPNATSAAATRTAKPTTEPPPTRAPEPSTASAPTTPATPTKPDKVLMPKVTGKNGAAAQTKLETLGLTDITFGSADPDASVVLLPQNWRVTKQDPRPGAKVTPQTPVVLTMVKLS